MGGLAANRFGDPSPAHYSIAAGLISEFLLTFIFLTVILGGEINAILDRVHKGIMHTEKEPGPATVHDPRPDATDPRPRPPRRNVKPA